MPLLTARRPVRSLFVAVGVAVGAAVCASASPAAGPARMQDEPAPYLRVVEENDGERVVLEAAVREFRRANGDGPALHVAAAIHIADESFYKSLQDFLDQQDVVLYEGVKPPGLGGEAALEGDEAKARATARRIRFIAMAAEAYKREQGEYPETIEQMLGAARLPEEMLQRSMTDLWARPLVYTLDKATGKYEVVSLGADGAEGGEGGASDLKLSDQKPLSKAERGAGGAGIQQQMADAMGLSFQLKVMDHSRANWRNSDMSVDQVQERLEKAGAGADQLFKMLDGSSMFAKLAGVLLEFVKASPSMQSMMKIMMIEMLGRADELMAAQAGAKLMSVIVDDRNAVVIEDFKRILADEPGVRAVGIIYGAGHLPDLQKRLAAETGYEPVSTEWRRAIVVDLAGSGTSAQQARQVREMIKRQLEAQLKRGAK